MPCMRQEARRETATAFHSAPPSVAQKSQFFRPTYWWRRANSEGLCRVPGYAESLWDRAGEQDSWVWNPRGIALFALWTGDDAREGATKCRRDKKRSLDLPFRILPLT